MDLLFRIRYNFGPDSNEVQFGDLIVCNGLWVPNALVLCPICGFENSETSANRRIELALNRKIGFSEFVPGFENSCLPDA